MIKEWCGCDRGIVRWVGVRAPVSGEAGGGSGGCDWLVGGWFVLDGAMSGEWVADGWS